MCQSKEIEQVFVAADAPPMVMHTCMSPMWEYELMEYAYYTEWLRMFENYWI